MTALRERMPQDDSFDVVGFLREELTICSPKMSEVILGKIQFLEAKDTEATTEKKEKTAEPSRKRRQADTFESLEPKMRKLQKQLAERAWVRRRFWRKFWSDFRRAAEGVVAGEDVRELTC